MERIEISVPDMEVKQIIVGDYTLEELANGYLLMGLIFHDMSIGKEVITFDKNYLETIGMVGDKLDKALSFVLAFGPECEYKRKGRKGKFGGTFFSDFIIADNKVNVYIQRKGFAKHMMSGDGLKVSMIKEAEEMLKHFEE